MFTFCHREGLTLYCSLYENNTFLISYEYIHLLSQRRTYSVLEFIYKKKNISYFVWMCSTSVAKKDLLFIRVHLRTIHFLCYINFTCWDFWTQSMIHSKINNLLFSVFSNTYTLELRCELLFLFNRQARNCKRKEKYQSLGMNK